MSATKPSQQSQTAAKVLEVLNVLMGHFAHGMTPTELSKATSLEPSAITRYVATLEATGFAERIPETGRIRPSVRFAQHAVSILRSVENARTRLDELSNRLNTSR